MIMTDSPTFLPYPRSNTASEWSRTSARQLRGRVRPFRIALLSRMRSHEIVAHPVCRRRPSRYQRVEGHQHRLPKPRVGLDEMRLDRPTPTLQPVICHNAVTVKHLLSPPTPLPSLNAADHCLTDTTPATDRTLRHAAARANWSSFRPLRAPSRRNLHYTSDSHTMKPIRTKSSTTSAVTALRIDW